MQQPFPQNVIAMIWDFDKTLIPGYMQQVIFDQYQVNEETFWNEVRELPKEYQKLGCDMPSTEVMYLNHILDHVRDGRFAGLSNAKLKELGSQIEFYPGMPALMKQLKEIPHSAEYEKYEIKLEHYVVSAGLKKLIEGSAIAPHLDGIWGCEFADSATSNAVIDRIAYVIGDTTKTRAIFEINKGVNKFQEYSVNDAIDYNKRRVPLDQMIYIADGPSDVPVFSIVKRMKGETYGVYNPDSPEKDSKVLALNKQLRLSSYGAADYRTGSDAANWLEETVRKIANQIIKHKDKSIKSSFDEAPNH